MARTGRFSFLGVQYLGRVSPHPATTPPHIADVGRGTTTVLGHDISRSYDAVLRGKVYKSRQSNLDRATQRKCSTTHRNKLMCVITHPPVNQFVTCLLNGLSVCIRCLYIWKFVLFFELSELLL